MSHGSHVRWLADFVAPPLEHCSACCWENPGQREWHHSSLAASPRRWPAAWSNLSSPKWVAKMAAKCCKERWKCVERMTLWIPMEFSRYIMAARQLCGHFCSWNLVSTLECIEPRSAARFSVIRACSALPHASAPSCPAMSCSNKWHLGFLPWLHIVLRCKPPVWSNPAGKGHGVLWMLIWWSRDSEDKWLKLVPANCF